MPKTNPAREALSRAVDKAIANGAPVYVNQPETFSVQTAWHSMAVGMYYRHQQDADADFVRWENQDLKTKLHWQSKAKAAFRTLGVAV